ncbi:MAG: hypothetical protein QME79_13275 [Bacillota bacterium]|nr:hypothetical protein [Bacillota bacterium]
MLEVRQVRRQSCDDFETRIGSREAVFNPGRFLTLRTRNSAAYKGIYALLLRDGALDFATGVPINDQRYFDDALDIHHIFPRAWCEKQGIPAEQYDSIIKKTPIAAGTNRRIQGDEPRLYLKRVQQASQMDDKRMDTILTSHVIDPALLRANDFAGFFARRREALLMRIEAAMGKPVLRDLATVDPGNDAGADGDAATDFQDEVEIAG